MNSNLIDFSKAIKCCDINSYIPNFFVENYTLYYILKEYDILEITADQDKNSIKYIISTDRDNIDEVFNKLTNSIMTSFGYTYVAKPNMCDDQIELYIIKKGF